ELKAAGFRFAGWRPVIPPKKTRLNFDYLDRASAGPSRAIRKYEALPSSSLWRCRPPDSRRRVSNDIRNWTAHCLTCRADLTRPTETRLHGWAERTRSAPGDRQGVGGASPLR